MSKYRVSNKRKSLYKLTYSFYDFYKSYPDKTISKEKFISIAKDYFTKLSDKIIYDRKIIRFPLNLTTLRIKKVKGKVTRKPIIDYGSSKLYSKWIYYNNSHSRGFYFKFYWERYPYFIKNKEVYDFFPSPILRKKLSAEIFKCNADPLLKDYDALL